MKLKKLLMAILVAISMMALVACGSEESSSREDNEQVESSENEDNNEEDSDKEEEMSDGDKDSDEDKEKEDEEEKVDETEKKEEVSNKEESNTEIGADSLEALEELINEEVEDKIAALSQEYEDLIAEINTYNKYKENVDKVEVFYNNVYIAHEELTVKLREYALAYAEMILNSDSSLDDKYDEMEEIYDVVYDGLGDELYDSIYDGILDDMYDDYYDGILDDAYDTVPYSEWSDLRSNEYDWWSDTRSDVYDDWSDFRSDVYDFYSDMRSALWDNDIEEATEEIEDFRADIIKLAGN